jgi:hypothetical protein
MLTDGATPSAEGKSTARSVVDEPNFIFFFYQVKSVAGGFPFGARTFPAHTTS